MDYIFLPDDIIIEIMINTHPYIVRKTLSKINKQYNTVYNKEVSVVVDDANSNVRIWRYLQTIRNVGNFPFVSLLKDKEYEMLYNILYPIANYKFTPSRKIRKSTPWEEIMAKEVHDLVDNIHRGYELNYSDEEMGKFFDRINEYKIQGSDGYVYCIGMQYGRIYDDNKFIYAEYLSHLREGMRSKIDGINIVYDDNKINVSYKDLWTRIIYMNDLYDIILESKFPMILINQFFDIIKTDELFKIVYYRSEDDIMAYINGLKFDIIQNELGYRIYSFSLNMLDRIIAIYCIRKDFNIRFYKYIINFLIEKTKIYEDEYDEDEYEDEDQDGYNGYIKNYIFTLGNKEIFYHFYKNTIFDEHIRNPHSYAYIVNSSYIWICIPWIIDICGYQYDDMINRFIKTNVPHINSISVALRSNDIKSLEYAIHKLRDHIK